MHKLANFDYTKIFDPESTDRYDVSFAIYAYLSGLDYLLPDFDI